MRYKSDQSHKHWGRKMIEQAAVLKLVATLTKVGSPALIGLLKAKTVRRRAARGASKILAREDIVISAGALRQWMARDDVQKQLAAGASTAIESALQRLATLIRPPLGSTHAASAARALEVLLEQILVASEPSTSTMIASRWSSAELASHHAALEHAMIAQQRSLVDATVDERFIAVVLPRLHPWRHDSVLELARTSEPFRALMFELARATDRADLLARWAQSTEARLADITPEGVAALSMIAYDLGEAATARTLSMEARSRGAEPAEYLLARELLSEDWRLPDDAPRLVAQADTVQLQHPFTQALCALAEGDPSGAIDTVHEYVAATAEDRVLASLLESAILASTGDLNGAIAAMHGTLAVEGPSSVGRRTAELLLHRSMSGSSPHRSTDLRDALKLSLGARDAARQWDGNSARALKTALQACNELGDWDRALSLCSLPPHGEAVKGELGDLDIRKASARFHAIAGDIETATELAAGSGDAHTIDVVAAIRARRLDEPEESARLWRAAWDSAHTDEDRLAVALNLALFGAELPPLDDLARVAPDETSEILKLRDLMKSPGKSRITRLRANAHRNWRFAVLAADEVMASGEVLESAKILEEAGTRFHDASLMRMAGRRYLQAKHADAAVSALDRAIDLGGDGWHEHVAALMTKFDALQELHRDDDALAVARHLVDLAPDEPATRWALVLCLLRRGDAEEAWAVIETSPAALEPRAFDEARAWVSAASAGADHERFVLKAIELADKWSHSGEDTSLLIGAVLARPTGGDELSEETRRAFQEAIKRHITTDMSRAVRVIRGDDTEQLLAALLEEAKRTAMPPEVKETVERARRGEVPVAMIAEAAGRTYLEVLLSNVATNVFIANPGERPAGKLVDLSSDVVLDVTAIHTLGLVDTDSRELLLGSFSSAFTTDACIRDIRNAADNLGRRSTLSVGLSKDEDSLQLFETSEEEAEILAKAAAEVADCGMTMRAVRWTSSGDLSAKEWRTPWLDALDYALANGSQLWSDDRFVRRLAAAKGVAAFSTLDLVESLIDDGQLDVEQRLATHATLIHHRFADMPLDWDAMRLAAELDGWAAAGAASVLARPQSWRKAEAASNFTLEAIGRFANSDPIVCAQWAYAAAHGLLLASHDLNIASRNLGVLLRLYFASEWRSPDLLPHIVQALRDAARDVGAQLGGIVEVDLEPIFRDAHRALVGVIGAAAAAQALLTLVAHMPTADRQLAVEVVIAPD